MSAWKVGDMLLWADPALLVVNKPAGLPTLPDGYQREAPCLVNLLSAEFPSDGGLPPG